jgi:hypothetical protein
MAISVDWATRVITIPTSFLTHLSGPVGVGGTFELDVNAFRLALKALEADVEGMPFPDTHTHNTEVQLGITTYARVVEIINDYTVEFAETPFDQYTVICSGANHNIADVKVVNTVSLIIGNAAGLVVVNGTGGASTTEILEMPVEGSLDFQGLLQVLLAVAAGKSSITGSTVTFRDQADSKNRVTAGMTGSERTTITLDPN